MRIIRLQVDTEIQDRKGDKRSDLELVAAMNGGDAIAFEVLYLRYRDWVVGLASRFTGDEDLAMDVLQETFLYLLKKFPGFALTASFKTFIYPAVKNLAIAARKKARGDTSPRRRKWPGWKARRHRWRAAALTIYGKS